MPKLSFRIQADYDKVQRLREKIAKLKQEIKGTDAIQNPVAFNNLNNKLQQTSKELGSVTGKIAQASATMETDFKQKIFAASQGVNDFTEKIIAQKGAVRETQDQVRKLAEAYREAKKAKSGDADGLFSQWKDAKSALDSQRSALFSLTQEQATARLSVKRLNDEYKAFRQEGGGTAQTMDLLSSKMKGIAATVMGGMGLKELASRIISVRAEFESMETSLKVLLGGNQQRLDSIMAQIKEYALASPLNTKDMVGAVQMMAGFGIEAEKSIDYLKAMGDISMGNTQKFNSMVLAFSQMSATGKLMGGDLNQLINAGFNPLEEISRKTGKSIGELKEEMSKGAISAKMVQDAFISVTSAGGKFYGMASEGAKTLNGQISMLQESFDNMFNEIGSKGEGAVMTAVQTATKLVENYEQVGRVILGLIETYGAYRVGLAIATIAENGHTLAMTLARGQILLTQKAQALLNATMLANPYVLAATALGALVGMLITTIDSTTTAEDALARYNDRVKENTDKIQEEKNEIDKLIGTLEDETSSIESKNIAFNTLIAKYPTIFGKYKTEKDLIDHLTEARQRENAEIERKTALLSQKSYNESKTRAAELNRLKYLYENGITRTEEYNRLSKKYNSEILKNSNSISHFTFKSSLTDLAKSANEEYKLNINENRKSQIAKYNANVGNLSKAQAQKELARLRSGLKKMDKSGKNYLKIGNNEPLSRAQIKERITLLENNVKTERKTMAQWRKEAEKETKKNRKAAKDLAFSTELLTKDQAEKKMKAANDTLATSEKSEKNFDIQDKSGAKAAAKAERERKQQIKDANAHQKAVNDLDSKKIAKSQAQVELENQVEQSRIDALTDGSEKTLAAMKLAHKKELEQIEKQKEEYLKKKQDEDEAEAEFKADPKNKNKTFNRSVVTLSADEQAKFATIKANVEKKQANEVGEYNKKQAEYITAYLKGYGTMQEQREAITKEYDVKIEAETNEWQKKILAKQKEAALSTFDFNAFQNAINWDVVFGNLTKVSKKALDTMEAQLEAMRSKISAKGTLSADEVNELKTITEAIEKIRQRQATLAPFETISESIKEYGEDLKRLHEVEKAVSDAGGMMYDKENTLAEAYDNAIKAQDMATVAKLQDVTVTVALTDKTGKVTYQTMKYVEALKLLQRQQNKVTSSSDELQKGINGAGGTLSNISQISREAEGLADALGVKLPQGVSTAIDGIGDMGQAMENFDITKPGSFLNIKNYVQFAKGVTNAFKGVGETIGGIFGFGGSGARRMREYQEAVAKYSSLKTVWDDLIDRKKEYLNMSWGVEKNKTQAEIKALQEAETKGIVAEAYAYLGTKDKHHGRSHTNYTWQSDAFSNGEYSDRHDHNNEAFWEQLNRQLYAAGFDEDRGGNKLNLTEAADLFNLTYDELLKIMQLYPERWAAMSDQMRGYLKEYMNSLKTAEDFAQEQKDAVIGSISDISNALKSLADDTDTSMDNLMEAFDKTANAQIWNELTKKGGDYYKRMEAYQKHYQEAIADGHFSTDDKQRLEDEYKSIYADLNAAYDRRKAELGTEHSDNQNATANGATEITYEQANNIVALTTAGNIAREQIKDRLTLMNATMDDIRALMNQSPTSASYASDTRQIINNSYAPQIQVSFPKEELQDIKHDVRELRGIVDEMRTHGADRLLIQQQITGDIARIAKNGMEIKSYVLDIKKDTKNLQ